MTQIEELRVEYGKIEKMDPSGPLYENLINALELLSLRSSRCSRMPKSNG